MRIDGIQLSQGSNISNLTVASGTAFPSGPDEGELFFRTDADVTVKGLYCYIAGSWDRIASTETLSVPSGAALPGTANTGDLFYKTTSVAGLYVFDGSSWVSTAGSGLSYTITGDVTGTIDGGTDTLTLATVNANTGSFGNSSSYVQFTVNAKGLITAASTGQINIDAAQVVSGTFPDARISQSSVTQHQASLVLAASQTQSGTFADARISQSSVTQHQAALTIAETQITDGALLARVGGNETISGSWTFNNAVVSAEPSSSSHLTTKNYVDNAIAGLTWKRSVKAATISNITLSGTQTIDGVALNVGDRVLVKNQATASENGVWVVASGTWTRATDFDSTSPIDEVNSAAVFVQQGSTQSDTGWTQTAPVTTVGTDSMTFVQFSAAGAYTAGAGLSLTGNVFNVGTASSSRIVVNVDDIDLATVTDAGGGSLLKFSRDNYGRVTGTSAISTGDLTSLLDSSYVNVTGDTMTGTLNVAITTGTSIADFNNSSGSAGVIRVRTTTLDSAYAFFQNSGTGTTLTDGLQIGIDSTSTAYIVNNEAAPLIFQTSALERMRITSDGSVQIGSSSGTNFGLLVFKSGADDALAVRQDGAGIIQSWRKSGGVVAQVDNNGNFGIAVAPSYRLDVQSAVNGTTTPTVRFGSTRGFFFQPATGSNAIYGPVMGLGAYVDTSTVNPQFIVPASHSMQGGAAVACEYNGNLDFYTYNVGAETGTSVAIGQAQRMRLSAAGNLLIGTATDGGSTQLEVVRSSAAHIIARSTSAAGYTSVRLYNSVNSNTRSLELDYTGPSFGTALTGGPSGEQAVITTPGAYPIVFGTSNTLRLMLDAGGSVLVNRSSTSGLGALQVNGVTDLASTNSSGAYGSGEQTLYLRNPTSSAGARGAGIRFDWNANTGGAAQIDLISVGTNGGSLSFGTRPTGGSITERMVIDSGGSVLVGTNSTSGNGFKVLIDGTGPYVQSRRNSGTTSTHHEFANTNGVVGSITTNGTATAYNTSSDARLKDNIAAAPSAGAKIDALQVRSYDWKADGTHVDHGLIAQELVEVLPEAVAVGSADMERPWAVDYSKLVPLLLKEIQELRARVAALESK